MINSNEFNWENIAIGAAKYDFIMAKFTKTDVSNDEEFQKRFTGFYRIRRNKELSKELIDRLMRQNKCELGKNLNDEYRIPFESTKALLKKGLIKEVKIKVEAKE